MKSHNSDSSAQTPAELLAHLQQLVVEAESMAGDKFGEPAAEAVEALRVRFNAAQKRLGELYSQAREKVAACAHETDVAVHAHPYQAIAIGAAVGVLVGVLIGRRTSRGNN